MAARSNIVFACAVITNFSSGMIAFDLASPSEPRILSQLGLSGAATHLAISGGYAFVAAQKTSSARRDGAIHVIDVADPEHPVLKTTVSSSYSPIRATVAGHLLFVSDGGMQILDISDPIAPRLIARLAPNLGVIDIAVHEDYAYAATFTGSLLVVDISDINKPSLVNTVLHSETSDDVEIANGTLFVTAGTAGLFTFDISVPSSPKQLGSANPSGNFQSTSVLIRDNHAFVTGQSSVGGVRVFDVLNPADPVLAGQLVDSDPATGGYSVGLACVGGNVVFTTGHNAKTHLNVISTTPSASTSLGAIAFPAYNPGKVSLAGSKLFYGKFSVDVVDSRRPVVRATNSFQGFDALSGSRGIALEGLTLRSFLIDVSGTQTLLGEANLLTVSNYSASGVSAAVVSKYAFIGTRSAGLLVYDLEPDSPVLVRQLTNTSSIISVAGSQDLLAVAFSRLEGNVCCISEVTLFDVTNPLALEPVAELTGNTNVTKVALDDDLLLITDRAKQLHAFDVSTPTHIVPKGAIGLRDYAQSISLNGGVAVVAEGVNGYEAFEVGPSGSIRRIAGDSAVASNALANRGPIVFAANASKGLKIATVSPVQPPPLNLSATRLNSNVKVQLRLNGTIQNETIIQRSNDLKEWSEWQRIPSATTDPLIDAEISAGQFFFRALQN